MSTADRQAKRFLREPAAYELKGAITPCMALWRHMTPKAVQGLVNAASRACHKLDALESQCDALEDRVADAEAENAELRKPLKFPRHEGNDDIIEGAYINRIRDAMPEDAPAWALDPYFIRLALLAVEKVSAPANEESER